MKLVNIKRYRDSDPDYSNVNVSGVRVAQRLGNANNDLNDGPAYCNLNNDASNSNANIGVAKLLGSSKVFEQWISISYTAGR